MEGQFPGTDPAGAAGDPVDGAAIQTGLITRVLGRQVEYRPVVGSTNEVAKALAWAGAPEGLVVVADLQTAGRGRMGRPWLSPPGSGIWLSLVLRPSLPLDQVTRLTLLAAVAVVEAVRETTGLGARIKWPNDVLIAGRKCCGVLTEAALQGERLAFVILGIGLNTGLSRAEWPPDLAPVATSLAAELGRRPARAPLVRALLARLEAWYGVLLGGGQDQVLARWRALNETLGRAVRVLPAAGAPYEGQALDIDGDGALLVAVPGQGVVRLVAGDVSVRPL